MTTATTPVSGELGSSPVAFSDGPLGVAQRDAWEIGRRTASQARAVAEFASRRPSSVDRQPGEPGCASAAARAARPDVLDGVSEWAAQEVAVALQLTQHAAVALLTRSLTLVHRLPATLAALESGALHTGHLWAFTERVGSITDPAVRARAERDLLGWMAGRVTTSSQLAERARVLGLRFDAAGAAQRLVSAVRRRGVFCVPGRDDVLDQLTAVLTAPESRACLDALGRYADSIDDADLPPGPDGAPSEPRTRSQKMADCLVDLILRPGETELPVVAAHLTVVASVETLAGGDEPGEVDGQVVPAEMVRHLARALGLVPDAVTPDAVTPDAVTSDAVTPDVGAPDSGAGAGTSASGAGATDRGNDVSAGHEDDTLPPAHPGDVRGHSAWDWGPAPLADLYEQLTARPGLVSDAEWASLVTAWQRDDPDPGSDPGSDPDPDPDPDSGPGPGPDSGPDSGPDCGPDSGPDPDSDPDCGPDPDPDPDADADPGPDADPDPGSGPDRLRRAFTAADEARPGSSADDPVRTAGNRAGTWAGADSAVWAASRAVEDARALVVCAGAAVRAAERAARTEETRHQGSRAGATAGARSSVAALAGASAELRGRIEDLLNRTAGGGLADRPRIAVVDALNGTLLALTDAPELRRLATCGLDGCARRTRACGQDLTDRPGLTPPGPTDGYRPGRALDRYVRARDRRCRFPGCRNRVPRGGQLDHDRRWPDGPTAATNLTGYCTRHHRGKHQAPGWRHHLAPDGTLCVTTPTGLRAVTEPPPYPTTPPYPATRSDPTTRRGSAATGDDSPPF